MRISTFFYCFRQGIKNLFKNKLFTLASISTMTACIFLFGMFYAIVVNIQTMLDSAESNVCITVFFDNGMTEDEIKELGDKIGKLEVVARMKYTSPEEAWEKFKVEYLKGHEELAEAFADDNPLADSASYTIYLTDVALQKDLVDYLRTMEGIRQVNESEVLAESFSGFGKLVAYVSAGIIIILFAVSIFLISNTVTVGITVRKEEIYIMKIIGATDFFVRFPFIVEGIIIGLLGAAIPLGIIYYVYNYVVEYVAETFAILSGIMDFVSIDVIYRSLLPVGLILGIGIGFLGSSVTVRRHIKV